MERVTAFPCSGLGVPCWEAQADGLPCFELGVRCGECDRVRRLRGAPPLLEGSSGWRWGAHA